MKWGELYLSHCFQWKWVEENVTRNNMKRIILEEHTNNSTKFIYYFWNRLKILEKRLVLH